MMNKPSELSWNNFVSPVCLVSECWVEPVQDIVRLLLTEVFVSGLGLGPTHPYSSLYTDPLHAELLAREAQRAAEIRMVESQRMESLRQAEARASSFLSPFSKGKTISSQILRYLDSNRLSICLRAIGLIKTSLVVRSSWCSPCTQTGIFITESSHFGRDWYLTFTFIFHPNIHFLSLLITIRIFISAPPDNLS